MKKRLKRFDATAAATTMPIGAAPPARPLGQLQRQLGNQHTTTLIQLLRDQHGKSIKVDWLNLAPNALATIIKGLVDEIYTLEVGERELFLQARAMHERGADSSSSDEEEDEEMRSEEEGELLSEEEGELLSEEEEEDEEMGEKPWFVTMHDSLSSSDESDDEFDKHTVSLDQEEIIKSMRPDLVKKFTERGKKLPGKGVQGTMLEQFVGMMSGHQDQRNLDANKFAMNIPGIDHLIDDSSHPFWQSKLHLSKSTANVNTYLNHYANRTTMAEKLLAALEKGGVTSDKIMQMLDTANKDDLWINKGIISTLINRVRKFRVEYAKALDNPKIKTLPTLTDDDTLVKLIADAIAFAVPKDLWEQLYGLYEKKTISPAQMDAYRRIDLDTGEFIQVFAAFEEFATDPKEKQTRPKDEDEDWKD